MGDKTSAKKVRFAAPTRNTALLWASGITSRPSSSLTHFCPVDGGSDPNSCNTRPQALKAAKLFAAIKKGLDASPEADRKKQVSKVKGVFQFDVTDGSKTTHSFYVDLKSGLGSIGEGPAPTKADVTLKIGDEDMVALASGKLTPMNALMTGKLKVSGNLMSVEGSFWDPASICADSRASSRRLATRLGSVLQSSVSKL